jgi:hypothetical protein
MPDMETLERMSEQASRGDWVQDALLRVLAADLIEKGEPLPPPLRNYVVTFLREKDSVNAVAVEAHELGVLLINSVTSWVAYGTDRADISKETVVEDAVNTLRRIREAPSKLGCGQRLPESLRDWEALIISMLFVLGYWGSDGNQRCSWEEAIAEVSELLDPDREADGKQEPRSQSGYSPRNIAIMLERIGRRRRELKGAEMPRRGRRRGLKGQ